MGQTRRQHRAEISELLQILQNHDDPLDPRDVFACRIADLLMHPDDDGGDDTYAREGIKLYLEAWRDCSPESESDRTMFELKQQWLTKRQEMLAEMSPLPADRSALGPDYYFERMILEEQSWGFETPRRSVGSTENSSRRSTGSTEDSTRRNRGSTESSPRRYTGSTQDWPHRNTESTEDSPRRHTRAAE
jgi:hypothetical protein